MTTAPGKGHGRSPLGLRRAWAHLGRADQIALLALVLIPVAIYLPILLTGRVIDPGDDLVQNLPLRELAGAMIRSGRLPAWNPLIWSGTPLLAGWNAGALFPGTFLFAFLPLAVAWTANYIVALVLCGVGMHLLLRRHRASPLASALGAIVFTYTGFMSGQVVHLGLEQGTALLPFVLLGIQGLALGGSARARIGFVALLGCAVACTVLAGDPRAISSTAIIAALYSIAIFWGAAGQRLRLAALLTGGVALGVALGAIQWLPGITFLSHSQRSSTAYAFFGSGSIGIARLTSQLLVPFIFGGNGNVGLPVYAGDYNLPELMIGSGLVALIALSAYAFPFMWMIRDHILARPRADDGRHLATWYVMAAVGLVLTLGTTIPLAKLSVHVPFFGSERLQNRNAVLFDLPLAVLVAFLVHDLGVAGSELRRLLSSRRRVVVLIAPFGCVAVCLAAILDGGAISRHYGLARLVAAFHGLRPYLFATIALAVGVTAAIFLASRLQGRRARMVVAVAVLIDVAFYGVNASYSSSSPAAVASSTLLSTALEQYTGPTGRFALYNPGIESPAEGPTAIQELGETDLNILHGDATIEGYGSIVSGSYQNETATHLFENVSRAALNSTTADALDLRVLATLKNYFSIPIRSNAVAPIAVSAGVVVNPSDIAIPPYASGPWPVAAGQPATFMLAAPTRLRRAALTLAPAASQPTTLAVDAISTTGVRTHRVVAVHDGIALVSLGSASTIELAVSDPTPVPAEIGAAVVVTADPGERLLLDGALQGVLAPPRWQYAGQIGSFSIWKNNFARSLAWLQSPSSTTADPSQATGGSAQVTTTALGAPQRTVVHSTKATLLVRSESYSGGWTVHTQPVGGGAMTVLQVRPLGLVQSVRLPKGDWVVTWRYAPASLLLGLIGTFTGLLALLLMAGWFVTRRTG